MLKIINYYYYLPTTVRRNKIWVLNMIQSFVFNTMIFEFSNGKTQSNNFIGGKCYVFNQKSMQKKKPGKTSYIYVDLLPIFLIHLLSNYTLSVPKLLVPGFSYFPCPIKGLFLKSFTKGLGQIKYNYQLAKSEKSYNTGTQGGTNPQPKDQRCSEDHSCCLLKFQPHLLRTKHQPNISKKPACQAEDSHQSCKSHIRREPDLSFSIERSYVAPHQQRNKCNPCHNSQPHSYFSPGPRLWPLGQSSDGTTSPVTH